MSLCMVRVEFDCAPILDCRLVQPAQTSERNAEIIKRFWQVRAER